jgi:hypothetical protein
MAQYRTNASPKHILGREVREPLNSTRAGLLNHQTSKISINSIYMKISLWVFKIQGFEGGIGVPKRGNP